MSEKNERKVVNDAIQYWRGFADALTWLQESKCFEKIEGQLDRSHEMIEIYRYRLYQLKLIESKPRKRKKNERRNRRN